MKSYLKPEITVIELETSDIIATSNNAEGGANGEPTGDLTDD